MRCKCADSETPGFVTYSAPYIAPDLYTVSLVPCPDCGGTQVASCCEVTDDPAVNEAGESDG